MTVGELLVRCGIDTSNYNTQVNQVRSSASSLSNFLKNSFSFSVGMGMFDLVNKGMDALRDTVIGTNSDIETARIAFTHFLGSATEANKYIEYMKKTAMSTPFQFADLATGSKLLMAFGFQAKELPTMIEAIGNATAGLGISGQLGFERIGRALGQMRAKQKIMAQEMYQLGDVGINAYKYLADAMGLSVAQVMKLGEEGRITGKAADEAVNVIVNGMQKDFGGMMKAQSTSWKGLLSTLKDFTLIGAEVFEPVFKSTKNGLSGMVEKGREFEKVFKANGLKEAMKTILPSGFVNTLSSISNVVKTDIVPEMGIIISRIGNIISGLLNLGQGTSGLGSVLGGLVSGSLKLFADLLGWLENHLPLVRGVVYGLLYAFVAYKAVQGVVTIMLALRSAYLLVSSGAALAKIQVALMQGVIMLGATAIAEAVYLIYDNWESLPSFFASLGDKVSAHTTTLTATIVYKWQSALYSIKTFINDCKQNVATLMIQLGNLVKRIPRIGKGISKSLISSGKSLAKNTYKDQQEDNDNIMMYADYQQSTVDDEDKATDKLKAKSQAVFDGFKATVSNQFAAIKSLIFPSSDNTTLKTPKVIDNSGFDINFDSAKASAGLKAGVATTKGKVKAVLSKWQQDLNKQIDATKNALKGTGGLTNNKNINNAISSLKKAKTDAWKQYYFDASKYGKNSKQAENDLKIIRGIDTQTKSLNTQIQKNIATNITKNFKTFINNVSNNATKYLNGNRLKIDSLLNDIKINPQNLLKDYDSINKLFGKDLNELKFTKSELQKKLKTAKNANDKKIIQDEINNTDKKIIDVEQKLQDSKTEQVTQLKQQYERDKGVQGDMLVKWYGLLVDSMTGDIKKNQALIQDIKQPKTFNSSFNTNNNVSLTEGAVASGVIKALEYAGLIKPEFAIDAKMLGLGVSSINTIKNAKLAGY